MANPKKERKGIVAVFRYLDKVSDAVKHMHRNKQFRDHVIYSPTSYHELMEHGEKVYGFSEVRWFTLVGALAGIATGFGMPIGMDWDWPIVVGGKMGGFYSLPAYFVFGFELMVLFGALATIIGMIIMGRLPDPRGKIRHNAITNDRFVVFVPGVGVDSEQAHLLRQWGADEVHHSE
ncbi:MAG: DUF3341 domain-containing protein [Deltaproteobacteria bacterium]|nr:DUF3341 domain-containing protein [Deltaproteobacteria bacterium]